MYSVCSFHSSPGLCKRSSTRKCSCIIRNYFRTLVQFCVTVVCAPKTVWIFDYIFRQIPIVSICLQVMFWYMYSYSLHKPFLFLLLFWIVIVNKRLFSSLELFYWRNSHLGPFQEGLDVWNSPERVGFCCQRQ